MPRVPAHDDGENGGTVFLGHSTTLALRVWSPGRDEGSVSLVLTLVLWLGSCRSS